MLTPDLTPDPFLSKGKTALATCNRPKARTYASGEHMSKTHPIRSATPSKPRKRNDFPLFEHQSGRWCKKVGGKHRYFGAIAGDEKGQKALALWLGQKDDLLAGRTPRLNTGEPTVRDLLNRFLTEKKHLVDTHEITARSFVEYQATCHRVADAFGLTRRLDDLRSDDFEKLRKYLPTTWGPITVANAIQRVRTIFKYAYDAEMIDSPLRMGTFKKPSKKTLRRARRAKGPRMFEASELRTILVAAKQPLRSMFLLGINAGLGNADVGRLPLIALDLDAGWLHYPREKTEVDRHVPLWPETVDSLREAIAQRPKSNDPALADRVFLTVRGASWHKDGFDNPVSKETAKLLKKLRINGQRNFYALRHTTETIGGEAKDQVAVDAIMGHAREDMATNYRERISDERLRAVTDHIRAWLYGEREQ
jgi:integrase